MALVSTVRYSPAQLARLLRLPEPTPEQAAVIAAPLGPLAVVAGAARARARRWRPGWSGWSPTGWSARTGCSASPSPGRRPPSSPTGCAPGWNGCAARAWTDGPASPPPGAEDPFGGDPVIGTYHAYAGRLVGDNALREGLEPSMRLITPALSWQLAAQIVAAYDGPMDEIIWTPQTVTAAVLELAGDLSEHLREHRRRHRAWAAGSPPSATRCPGGYTAAVRKILDTQRAREQLLPLVERYVAAKAPARSSTTATRSRWRPGSPPPPGGRRGRAGPLPRGPAR